MLECHTELLKLMGAIDGIERVVSMDEPLPDVDLQCPLMSLPRVFKTNIDSIPASIPYLAVDPERAETWSRRLAPHADSRKVGVAWAGRPTHRYDRHRSLSLERLAPLGSVGSACEVTFFSLQKGEETRGVESASPGLPVVDYTQQIDDFADTAALIANLDLIITVDTAVAHLAARLGSRRGCCFPSSRTGGG